MDAQTYIKTENIVLEVLPFSSSRSQEVWFIYNLIIRLNCITQFYVLQLNPPVLLFLVPSFFFFSFPFFIGVFIFGGFAVMVIVDVTRKMTGRLRPDFLETCQVNSTLCSQSSSLDDSACLLRDKVLLQQAR